MTPAEYPIRDPEWRVDDLLAHKIFTDEPPVRILRLGRLTTHVMPLGADWSTTMADLHYWRRIGRVLRPSNEGR